MIYLIILLLIPFLSWSNTFNILEKKLEEIKTIRVAFVQKVQYSWYNKPDVSKGIFYAQRGGKFRIEYEHPESMLIVSDGREVFVYYPKERSGFIDRIENNKSPTIEALFLISFRLSEVFEQVGEIKKGDNTTLILKPKVRDDYFHRVYVELDEQAEIKSIKVEDKEGNTTTIQFLSVRKNFSPSDELFRIKIPSGARVNRL